MATGSFSYPDSSDQKSHNRWNPVQSWVLVVKEAVLRRLLLTRPGRCFDATYQGFELVEAELSDEAKQLVLVIELDYRCTARSFPRCTCLRSNQWPVWWLGIPPKPVLSLKSAAEQLKTSFRAVEVQQTRHKNINIFGYPNRKRNCGKRQKPGPNGWKPPTTDEIK